MKFITSKNYLTNIDYVFGSVYNGSNDNIKQFNVYYKHSKKSDLETIKIQLELNHIIFEVIPIVLSTYITLVIAILRFFKWEEIKENVSKNIITIKVSFFRDHE